LLSVCDSAENTAKPWKNTLIRKIGASTHYSTIRQIMGFAVFPSLSQTLGEQQKVGCPNNRDTETEENGVGVSEFRVARRSRLGRRAPL